MQVLAARAKALIADRDVSFEWVPRLSNKRADAAANESMDRRESFRRDLGRWTGLTARAGSSSAGRTRTSSPRILGADGAERDRVVPARGGPAGLGARHRGRPLRCAGCGATLRAGTPTCSPRACVSRAATTCGCATRSCATPNSSPRMPRCGPPSQWDATPFIDDRRVGARRCSTSAGRESRSRAAVRDIDENVREFARQRAAVEGSAERGRLRLLTAAESAGALIAVELQSRRTAVGCRDARRALDGRARGATGRRRSAGRGCRMPRAACAKRWATRQRAWTPSPSSCARFTGRAFSRSPRAGGSSPSTGIRSSSPSWSTRSCRACCRRTAGRGWPSGCTTVASGPSTSPAES